MQTLTLLFALLASHSVAKAAVANSGVIGADPLVTVVRRLPYSQEVSGFYRQGAKLICKTELIPYVPVIDAKAKDELFSLVKKFETETRVPHVCRDTVSVVRAKNKPVERCADERQSRAVLQKVARLCART